MCVYMRKSMRESESASADQHDRTSSFDRLAGIIGSFRRPEIGGGLLQFSLDPAIPPIPHLCGAEDQLPIAVKDAEIVERGDAETNRPVNAVCACSRRKSVGHENIG